MSVTCPDVRTIDNALAIEFTSLCEKTNETTAVARMRGNAGRISSLRGYRGPLQMAPVSEI